MGELRLGKLAIRYSQFVPKLYNYCRSLGFQRDRMMPSRAFCSDESQGYPIILLAQHFGTFPFDHGQVGGKVATDRHGPHAHHGEDLVIVQASHVGYDAERRRFGVYRRPRTAQGGFGANCGKLSAVLDWYQQEYNHARNEVKLGAVDGIPAVFIDNALLDPHRTEGLFLHLDRFIAPAQPTPLRILSTSKAFAASRSLMAMLSEVVPHGANQPIGDLLSADLFFFRREPVVGPEGHDLLEAAIAPAMPTLITSPHPALDAARYHTQIEFDRTYRTIQREPVYHGKNVLFVSGLNVDVSPQGDLLFPLTKFVPWAAYARLRDGTSFLLEQDALFEALAVQSTDNADQISFDAAIATMAKVEGIDLPLA
ncbi:MAG: hypothetical protein WDO24_07865 [Pseudomonadota bacterium]